MKYSSHRQYQWFLNFVQFCNKLSLKCNCGFQLKDRLRLFSMSKPWSLKSIYIILVIINPNCTWYKVYWISIYMKTSPINNFCYCDSYTKPINTMCRPKVHNINVETAGTYSQHCAPKRQEHDLVLLTHWARIRGYPVQISAEKCYILMSRFRCFHSFPPDISRNINSMRPIPDYFQFFIHQPSYISKIRRYS
jgi:hypothetical protein